MHLHVEPLKDLICFAFNNLPPCNLLDTVTEFSDSVAHTHDHLPWVAEYLVFGQPYGFSFGRSGFTGDL